MSFSELPPPDNGLASDQQQPWLVCTWSAHAPQCGSSRSPLPLFEHTLTATATTSGDLFLFGGAVSGTASRDLLYVFSTRDFSSTLLQTRGDVPSPRYDHSTALTGTDLLICGGKKDGTSVLNDLYRLNIVSREWTRVVTSPGVWGHTMTVVGSKLFLFGGSVDWTASNNMWSLELTSSQPHWELCEPAPGNKKPPRRDSHVSVTTEGRIIMFVPPSSSPSPLVTML